MDCDGTDYENILRSLPAGTISALILFPYFPDFKYPVPCDRRPRTLLDPPTAPLDDLVRLVALPSLASLERIHFTRLPIVWFMSVGGPKLIMAESAKRGIRVTGRGDEVDL